MNLEEAKANIGAEVELDESTKPYTYTRRKEYIEHRDEYIERRFNGVLTILNIDLDGDALIGNKDGAIETIHPRHIQFKPQSYKIHVPTEAESREAQELFFELGYGFFSGESKVYENSEYTGDFYFFAYGKDMDLTVSADSRLFVSKNTHKQITLQELRDMVAKKKGEDKKLQVTGTFQDFEPRKGMTWEDALRAVADDIKVEFYNELCGQWWDISHLSATEVVRIEKFRIAPKRIYLHGNYTKEELLKEIGEME